MIEVEFSTKVEVGDVEIEVSVVAEFYHAKPQTAVDNTGTPEAVFLVTVIDEHSTDVVQYLGDREIEILKQEVIKEAT